MSEATPRERLALVEVARRSDTGRVRHHNEDRSIAQPGVLAVADGMGGAKAGEVAAQVAVEALTSLIPPLTVGAVRDAVQDANGAIRQMARDDPERSGMGTTLTAAMLDGDRLDVVHVGDSRAYLWREGALAQMTQDHSVVAELVRRGSISAEEAEHHPHRNVITRALGAEARVVADTVSRELRAGDVILLCSDGLSSYVPESQIAAALADAADLEAAAGALVDLANAAGGADNVTVVLARAGLAEVARAGDTAEVPIPAAAGGTAPMRVLGGVGGHAGAERSGAGAPRSPRVLEPVPRRRSRLRPALVAATVTVALVVGGVAWVASRSYVLEESPGGGVRVVHGLPFDIAGQDLSVPWQEIDLDADTVRAGRPSALSATARGQGEAVELAASLLWSLGLPAAPSITAPPGATEPPTPTPAPAG